ncbi:hypothetical protein Tco_0494543 [Tanacetum coccineum]
MIKGRNSQEEEGVMLPEQINVNYPAFPEHGSPLGKTHQRAGLRANALNVNPFHRSSISQEKNFIPEQKSGALPRK